MKSILQLAAVLSLATSAVAQAVSCRTTLGTKSIRQVPTTTTTTTSARRPVQTLVVQNTVTTYLGLVSTSTRTNTRTNTVTASTDTDTYYVTTTSFQVATFSATTEVTTTTTNTLTTSSTSTTIVPTITNFMNIMDTINRGSVARREIAHPHSPNKRAVLKGPQGVLAQSRPNKVVCTKTMPNTKTYTTYTTLKQATKTMAYWSRTTVKVQTVTVDTTLIPDNASETITETSTSSVQTTTTIINTKTEGTQTTTTNVLPGPTVFNACNERNIFGSTFRSRGDSFYAVNVANNGPGVASDFQKIADGASTATECCNACQRLPTCETFIFRKQFRSCFLLSHEGATCSSQDQHPNFILSAPMSDDMDGSDGYQVGNGNCGYTWSGEANGKLRRVDL